jgi:hypothetical protein
MFGGKLTPHHIARGFQNLKHHITSGYHHTKNFLGNVDNAYKTAKKVYSIVAPHLEHFGGGNINKHVVKAIGGYEHVRNKVKDAHDNVAHHVNKVGGDLKKANINIGI